MSLYLQYINSLRGFGLVIFCTILLIGCNRNHKATRCLIVYDSKNLTDKNFAEEIKDEDGNVIGIRDSNEQDIFLKPDFKPYFLEIKEVSLKAFEANDNTLYFIRENGSSDKKDCFKNKSLPSNLSLNFLGKLIVYSLLTLFGIIFFIFLLHQFLDH